MSFSAGSALALTKTGAYSRVCKQTGPVFTFELHAALSAPNDNAGNFKVNYVS